MNLILRVVFLALFFTLAQPLAQADWPTYLRDETRVGYTPENIQPPLAPRWTYSAPSAPQLAWAGEDGKVFEGMETRNRIRFDDAFHVAMAGGRVYFGSSIDGRLHCRNLLSGLEEWTFFTDGPIRLAPAFAEGKIYAGSDDGYAYCLEAATGKLIWKIRAGPNDERILARGRMISRWPVRTGILVFDGTAYFGAGVFPHETVYLYAVEAASGKVVWKNDAISQEDAGRNDLSPQGYLLATKDYLYVPSGRSLAAAFNRLTGGFLTKPQPGWRGDAGGQIGGSQALLADDQIYAVGEHQILALDEKGKTGFGWFQGRQMTLSGKMGYMANGREIVAIDRLAYAEGSRKRHDAELAAAKLTRELRSHAAVAELKRFQRDQTVFNEARQKLKKLETGGKSAAPELAAAEAEVSKSEQALAETAKKYETLRLDYEQQQKKLEALNQEIATLSSVGIKWRYPAAHESALILAGSALIAGGVNEALCLDSESGKLLARSEVKGEARGLAAASGHVVVSTTEGKIHVFSDSSKQLQMSMAKENPPADPFPRDDRSGFFSALARTMLQETKVTKGYCLVLGIEEGRLPLELAKQSELNVYCLDADAEKVKTVREKLVHTGLYGSRIIVDHVDLSLLPYSSYFANLIVSESLLVAGDLPFSATEAARTLKPIGGVLYLGVPDTAGESIKNKALGAISDWMKGTGLLEQKAALSRQKLWWRLTRGPLPDAGAWSHQYGDAANTSTSEDKRIKGGLSVLWYGDPGPGKMVNRHDGAVGPVSVNGRLFVQGDQSVMAYDAYNGLLLWELRNPGALRTGLKKAYEPGNMAASDDFLFMVIGANCLQIDAATGAIRRTYTVPETKGNQEPQWSYIAYKDGLLFGAVTDRKELAAERQRRGLTATGATDILFAYDVSKGELLWKYKGQSISHVSIAVGDGKVFFVDSSLTPEQRETLLKSDKTAYTELVGEARKLAEERLKNADLRLAVALEARSGEKLWGKPVDVTDCSEIGAGGGSLTLIYHQNHIVLAGANANGHYWTQFLQGEFKRRRLVVLDAGSGETRWAKDGNYRHRPIVIDSEIIAEPWKYDLYTGEQKMRMHPITGEETPWMFARPGHHCGAISATRNMMFFRSKFTAFYNLDEDEGTGHFAGHRLGCWINTIPANGLVMVPEASAGCVCLFSIAATIVFEPRDTRSDWGVYSAAGASLPVRHMALNLGAPGDRRDARGKLWLSYPRPSSRAGIDLPLNIQPRLAKGGGYFSANADSFEMPGTDVPWVFASGIRGLERAEIPLQEKGAPAAKYLVRLYFASQPQDQPGQRVVTVKLQGRTVAENLDIVSEAGGASRPLVREFKDISVVENLALELSSPESPSAQPLLCGVEILRENAGEILQKASK